MSEEQIYVSSERITLISRFRELVTTGDLLWHLTLRDLKVRYKQSVLGIAWAMFIPLSMMLVFTFMIAIILCNKQFVSLQINRLTLR